MALRHATALTLHADGAPIHEAAIALAGACIEAIQEGFAPETDPAVLLLAFQIAFTTHMDRVNSTAYRQILKACEINKQISQLDHNEVH